jgi:hypothetical protein
MAVKGTAASEDLHAAIKKALQKLNIPILKIAGIVMDGVPYMAVKNSGLSMLIMKDVKNTTVQFVCLSLLDT